jgi:hypothetical protein
MNHRVRQANPNGPVIVVQDQRGKQVESNGFDLFFDGFKIGRVVFDPKGLAACKTHDVRAWVELEKNVEVVPDPVAAEKPLPFAEKPLVKKAATAKRPNSQVNLD